MHGIRGWRLIRASTFFAFYRHQGNPVVLTTVCYLFRWSDQSLINCGDIGVGVGDARWQSWWNRIPCWRHFDATLDATLMPLCLTLMALMWWALANSYWPARCNLRCVDLKKLFCHCNRWSPGLGSSCCQWCGAAAINFVSGWCNNCNMVDVTCPLAWCHFDVWDRFNYMVNVSLSNFDDLERTWMTLIWYFFKTLPLLVVSLVFVLIVQFRQQIHPNNATLTQTGIETC